MNFKNSSHPAVSLFISIAIISSISIVAMTLSNIVIQSIKRTAEIQQSAQAYFSSKAGIELAKKDIKSAGPGYETGSEATPNTFDLTASSQVKWWVEGLSSKFPSKTYYSIPRQNHGNAGEGCAASSPSTDWKNPCNWYKLYPKQQIAIPLYVQQKNGTVLNPVELEFTNFKLYVRGACPAETNCSQLSDDLLSNLIVIWQITGTCQYDSANDEECSLFPSEEGESIINGNYINNYDDSFLTNNKLHWESLSKINLDNESYLGDFLLNQDAEFTDNQYINKPVLIFSIESPIYDSSNVNIPYLEFQIQITTNSSTYSPSDRYLTIESTGTNRNFDFSSGDLIEYTADFVNLTLSL